MKTNGMGVRFDRKTVYFLDALKQKYGIHNNSRIIRMAVKLWYEKEFNGIDHAVMGVHILDDEDEE